MKIYFLRHTEALEGFDDAARPLSEDGRSDARKLGQFLKRNGIELDGAYASPLVRARETAEIVLEHAGSAKGTRLELAEALTNSASLAAFQSWLGKLPAARHVLLVGHEPTISERVRRLLGMVRPDALGLAKGALACVETEDRRTGALKWLVTPKRI